MGFIAKVPEEAIDKTYNAYMQYELHENGEKTAKALSVHVVNRYANIVGNFVQLDSVDALNQDIQQDPSLKT